MISSIEKTAAVQIEKVTPYSNVTEGTGVASVKLTCGPVVMHAKIRRATSTGGLYLSWPARENKDGKWFNHFYIMDADLRRRVEREAVQRFRLQTQEVEVQPAT